MFVTAVIAGGINSVAGGGCSVTFPTLIWLGVPSITANATNTVAIWPGTLGSVWGYRRELRGVDPRVYALDRPERRRRHRRRGAAAPDAHQASSTDWCPS